jgi:hypothetical protein
MALELDLDQLPCDGHDRPAVAFGFWGDSPLPDGWAALCDACLALAEHDNSAGGFAYVRFRQHRDRSDTATPLKLDHDHADNGG